MSSMKFVSEASEELILQLWFSSHHIFRQLHAPYSSALHTMHQYQQWNNLHMKNAAHTTQSHGIRVSCTILSYGEQMKSLHAEQSPRITEVEIRVSVVPKILQH